MGMKSSAQEHPAFFFPSLLSTCGLSRLTQVRVAQNEYKSCWFEQLSILEIDGLRLDTSLSTVVTCTLLIQSGIGSSGVDKNT